MSKVSKVRQQLKDISARHGLSEEIVKALSSELDMSLNEVDRELSDAQQQLEVHNTWWKDNGAEVQTRWQMAEEVPVLKTRMERLRQAGLYTEDELGQAAPPNRAAHTQTGENANTSSSFDPTAFENKLYGVTGAISKDLMKVGLRHMKDFNEEPDFDEIEKIVRARNMRIDDAYNVWAAPKIEAKRAKEQNDYVAKKIQEGVQDELTRRGVSHIQPQEPSGPTYGEYVRGTKPKDTPSEAEVREMFLNDLNSVVTRSH